MSFNIEPPRTGVGPVGGEHDDTLPLSHGELKKLLDMLTNSCKPPAAPSRLHYDYTKSLNSQPLNIAGDSRRPPVNHQVAKIAGPFLARGGQFPPFSVIFHSS